MFITIQGQSRDGETWVLDSAAGHRKTFDALIAFLSGADPFIELGAAAACPLRPDSPPLRAFRMVKTGEKLRTEALPNGVLQVSGRPELLAQYVDAFRFDPGAQGERHPEAELFFTGGLDPDSGMVVIGSAEGAGDPDAGAP